MKKPEPKYVAATLKWCNARRKEQGKKPLKRMPKGKIWEPDSCPCGKAAKLYVSVRVWGFQGEKCYDKFLPRRVRAFVKAFDAGKLPQYELK